MYGSSLPIGGVANVYLANFMRKYSQANLVANLLAPTVPVAVQVGNYIVQDRASQRVLASTLRTPGSRPVQTQMGYSKDVFSCRSHAVSVKLPFENTRTAGQYGLDLKQSAVAQVKQQLDIRREAEVVTIVKNGATNSTTLSGTDIWSNAGSDPIQQIEALKLMIKYSGQAANYLFLGPDVASAARQNPAIIERFKYTNTGGNITNELLATAFGVSNVVEAGAVQTDGLDIPSFLWDGLAVLAFVQPVVSQMDVSAMKTFVDTTQGVDGYEAIEFPDPYPDAKTDWVSGDMAYDLKVTGQDTFAVLKNAA